MSLSLFCSVPYISLAKYIFAIFEDNTFFFDFSIFNIEYNSSKKIFTETAEKICFDLAMMSVTYCSAVFLFYGPVSCTSIV
jgi:hypothetical protein